MTDALLVVFSLTLGVGAIVLWELTKAVRDLITYSLKVQLMIASLKGLIKAGKKKE